MSETPQPTRIRDMEWEDFRKLLRMVAPEIGQLALRGDQFAVKVMACYQYAYDHQRDKKAEMELRTAVEDYVNRDLRIAEQVDLGSRFGHRLPEPDKDAGARIFVPGPGGKQ